MFFPIHASVAEITKKKTSIFNIINILTLFEIKTSFCVAIYVVVENN